MAKTLILGLTLALTAFGQMDNPVADVNEQEFMTGCVTSAMASGLGTLSAENANQRCRCVWGMYKQTGVLDSRILACNPDATSSFMTSCMATARLMGRGDVRKYCECGLAEFEKTGSLEKSRDQCLAVSAVKLPEGSPGMTVPETKTVDSGEIVAVLLILCGIAIGIWLYFLPAWIAARKHKRNTGAIFFCNLIFGWTLVGWLACFIWALTNDLVIPRQAQP